MGVATKIQWTDHTFNPWRGCTKISPGCANCYAETMSHRNPAVLGIWGPQGTRVVASEAMWREPLKWDREAARAGERRRVFCASLADIFEDRDDLIAPRRRLARLVWETQSLDYLFLTKRPENAGEMVYEMWFPDAEWPKNWWLGTSVEDQQRASERIPALLRIPAPVRFLSVEPLLGPVDLSPWLGTWDDSGELRPGIDWAIVGGESGAGARPCHAMWIRSVVGQCREAGAPCFVKQMGSNFQQWYCGPLKDGKGGDPDEWPEDLRVREFPR
jgi:protein gp37